MTTRTRATGLETIPQLKWGTHLCQFYKTGDDLISVTLPFIKAGLENNEYCLWVAWEPVDTALVTEALANELPDPSILFDSRQIEVASHCTPDFQRGLFCRDGLVDAVKERIEKAVSMGHEGARIVDNLSWHHESDWCSLMEGERAASEVMAQLPVMALCSYPVVGCTGFQMKDIGAAHHYVLVSVGGQCEVIEGGQRREEREEPQGETEAAYREVFQNMVDGFVLLDTETMEGLLANDEAARILGFESPGEMVGMNPFRSFTGPSRHSVGRARLRGLLTTEDRRPREITGIAPGGREVRLGSVGVRTEYQGRPAELIAVRDMTGCQKPQRQQRSAQKRENAELRSRA